MANVFDTVQVKNAANQNNEFAEFLQYSGLYAKKAITSDNLEAWLMLLNGDVRLHNYCVECNQVSVFSMEPIHIITEDYRGSKNEVALAEYLTLLRSGRTPGYSQSKPVEEDWRWHNSYVEEATQVIRLSYHCAMNENHRIEFIVATDATSVRKIGQYPSVADLSFPELKKYEKVISKEDRKELRRAIGLHAQGIGVGSYVYLRRVFERVIDSAKDIALSDGKISEEAYAKAHVNERIKMLKDYLPPLLVENTVFYGIVSKGIHELSEEECTTYFPIMKEFIFMILRQWEQQRQDKEAQSRLASSLSNIATNI